MSLPALTRLSFSGRRSGRQFKLGDELRVIVSKVDAYKRQIDFTIVDDGGEPVQRVARSASSKARREEPVTGRQARKEKPQRPGARRSETGAARREKKKTGRRR